MRYVNDGWHEDDWGVQCGGITDTEANAFLCVYPPRGEVVEPYTQHITDVLNGKVVLAFIRSLALCDHMGDVGYEVGRLLDLMGIELGEWEDFDDLNVMLEERDIPYLFEIVQDKEEQ